MSEPKFTPGPWLPHLGYGPSSEIELYVDVDIPATKEDFKLIAAAPELYEALEFLLTCKHGEFCDHYREAERKAKAALAKARGESNDR